MRKILGFGTYDVDSHPRVSVLLEGLKQQPDTTVRELDRPLNLSTAERVAILKQPWRLPVLAAKLGARWSSLAVGSGKFRGLHSPDALLVGYMGHFDVLLARLLFPKTTLVLDHLIFAAGTARDRGEDGVKAKILEGLDYLATHAADVVILDTTEHAQLLDAKIRDRGIVVPVGAPAPWYQAGAARRERTEPVCAQHPLSIIFFGLYTPLQGAATIAAALQILADRQVPFTATLVGDGQDRAECEAVLHGCQNITWLDWVAAKDLPATVAAHDVCLGIVGTTAKALAVVPNKVYQGLAAGCAVVTSDTAPQRRIIADGALYVPPGDAAELAAALERLATDGHALAQAKARARSAAESFTPRKVTLALSQRLNQEIPS